ncbi:hypothetical protein EES41_00685 [Streptomyces sp. ADI95-16]|uniref:hypothetical protein n=1 Tax=Streptomyces sp. ADI95-16 TaxID=1522758 RepID=UPI000F3A9F04|nr:hypothetical protein [Streptomyces sp. ADI95-16]AYV25243.1 hypothetical protein EES41_00685 [Streptomyces sp. ADI95-16]
MKSMIALRECGIQLRDEVQATGVRISSKRGPGAPGTSVCRGLQLAAGWPTERHRRRHVPERRPLHLMWLFGLSDGVAMRYVTAAHPEHTAGLSR